MYWAVLIFSAIFEAVWATALGHSEGFTNPIAIIIFFIALIISMGGLGYAVKEIPIGTGYAVWTGIGATLTVVYAIATGVESVSLLKVIFIFGIIIAVIGLKLTDSKAKDATAKE